MTEYLEEHPHMFEHLLLTPRNPKLRYKVEDYWNEWNGCPFTYAVAAKRQIEQEFAKLRTAEGVEGGEVLRWREHHFREFGWGEWRPSGSYVEDLWVSLYHTDEEPGVGDVSAIIIQSESLISTQLLTRLGRSVGASHSIVPHLNTVTSL